MVKGERTRTVLVYENYIYFMMPFLATFTIQYIYIYIYIYKDVSICLIDKTQSPDPRKREYYWMRILKTLAPSGLITEDTY